MSALRIQFLPPARRPSLVSCLLLLVAVAYAVAVAQQVSDAQDALEQSQARQARMERQLRKEREAASSARAQSASDSREPHAAAMERMDAQLKTPWNSLFRTLETHQVAGVALMQLDLDGAAHSARISGEAKNMDDVMRYIDALQSADGLSDVELVGHEERVRGSLTLLRFNLSARWGGAPATRGRP